MKMVDRQTNSCVNCSLSIPASDFSTDLFHTHIKYSIFDFILYLKLAYNKFLNVYIAVMLITHTSFAFYLTDEMKHEKRQQQRTHSHICIAKHKTKKEKKSHREKFI